MGRNQVSALVTEKALSIRNNTAAQAIIDAHAAGAEVGLKNVCAKVCVQLADELDSVCHQLGIPKRLFVESAIIDGLKQAEAIISEELDWQEAFATDPDALDANVEAYKARKVSG